MFIWFDGQCLQSASNVRGIGRYVSELLVALARQPDVQLAVSLNANMAEHAIAARRYLHKIVPSADIHLWYGIAKNGEASGGINEERRADSYILARHLNEISPDIAISPSPFEGLHDQFTPFLATGSENFLTACIFHDAIPHRYPERYLLHQENATAYYRRLGALTRFDLVLCNSDFTAREYADLFGKQNFCTIGAGLTSAFAQSVAEQASVAADALDRRAAVTAKPYVLYVGGLDWRKNLGTLVDGMAKIQAVRRGELTLLIAGDHFELDLAPLRRRWSARGLPDAGLICSGWVSDGQLVELYRGADLAVQPSLMEGFGLAALEAMALGCPFLAARGGAVSEVVADDSLVFDGQDPIDLAERMTCMLDDRSFRQRAIAHGLKRAAEFSWDRSASIALASFRELSAANRQVLTPPRVSAPVGASPRLVMDITSTALSSVNSGIQRVVRRLSQAMQQLDPAYPHEMVLAYAHDHSGWYAMDSAQTAAIRRDPTRQLDVRNDDIHFLIDSSWEEIDIQRPRLRNALMKGQWVVHGVHDLGPLTMPALTSEGMPPHFARWFEFVLGYSTGIICVSRAVADEVHRLIEGIKLPRAMDIGYLQLGADFAETQSDAGWLTFLEGRPTFLMVGTIEPRKGHMVVLEAFERVWAEGHDVNLLIIGKQGWGTVMARERLAHHPETGKRMFVRADVSDAQLHAAYDVAVALIMASYLEGFGLPVVEAAALGCRVILSDIPVFREVSSAAHQASFFPSGDAPALANAVCRVLAEDSSTGGTTDRLRWPDWGGTARQVHDIILGNRWYKRYIPAQIEPNAVPGHIGTVIMEKPLTKADRRHALRWVEGPLVSDDKAHIQITVGVRNLGSAIWSNRGRRQDNAFRVTVGSHILARDGSRFDHENGRSLIPFVVLPGDEILMPIRVTIDWLTRGAAMVEVELVQEAATWFGDGLRLPLYQSPTAEMQKHAPVTTTSLDGLHLSALRRPFAGPKAKGCFILLAATNISSKAVTLSQDDRGAQITDSLGVQSGRVVGAFSALAPGAYGLMLIHLPEVRDLIGESIRIALADPKAEGAWHDLPQDIWIDI